MANPTMAEKLRENNILLLALLVLAEIFGITALALLVHWLKEYYGGYSFDKNDSLLFAYHPIFMFVGMIFLFGNSMMIFRVTRAIPLPKIVIKIVHGALHTLSILFICLGLYAVVRRNNVRDFSDMYSFHSWYGVSTIAVFFAQYFFGIIAFLIPVLSDDIKRSLMPVHRFLGSAAFLMAMMTVLTGLAQMTGFIGRITGEQYSDYPTWGDVLNLFTMFSGFFVLMVMIVVTNNGFQRKTEPTSEEVHQKHAEHQF